MSLTERERAVLESGAHLVVLGCVQGAPDPRAAGVHARGVHPRARRTRRLARRAGIRPPRGAPAAPPARPRSPGAPAGGGAVSQRRSSAGRPPARPGGTSTAVTVVLVVVTALHRSLHPQQAERRLVRWRRRRGDGQHGAVGHVRRHHHVDHAPCGRHVAGQGAGGQRSVGEGSRRRRHHLPPGRVPDGHVPAGDGRQRQVPGQRRVLPGRVRGAGRGDRHLHRAHAERPVPAGAPTG